MKNWVISYILAFGLQLSVFAGEENVRAFRRVDPMQLEKKVPPGYGHVFVQAGRQYNIDPVVLAAISAHESGGWKSRVARKKNNWMGLMTRKGAKSFGTPEESIFYAAGLLNRGPFKGRNTLSQIAQIYCAKSPGRWKASVLQWEDELAGTAHR
jgi:Mannosyl-glycoprotein endo-beta-N-acetylglucosaminidase